MRMSNNNRIGVNYLWSSLQPNFQRKFFTPNWQQPRKNYCLSEVPLRRLGFYKNANTGKLIAPCSSRFSKDYYENFELKPVKHSSPFPFYLTISEEAIEHISSSSRNRKSVSKRNVSKKQHKLLIEYTNSETDSLLVYSQLTDLDKHILLFIALFRNVQFQQIIRETGVSASRVERSLQRLLKFYLIRQYKYKRDPIIFGAEKGNLEGDCYGIYGHGTTVLLVNNIISSEVAHKWNNVVRQEDTYSPIRYWKIVDAYLHFRVKDDFIGFLPHSYIDGYLCDKGENANLQSNIENTGLSEQSKRIINELQSKKENNDLMTPVAHKYKRYVPRIRFYGQFRVKGKLGNKVSIDLFPLVTTEGEDNDLVKLNNILLHFSRFEDGKDKEGNQRLLMIIVDTIDRIQEIENKYHLSNMKMRNILFLDLETASQTDIAAATKVLVLDEGQTSYNLKSLRFNIAEALLNRSDSVIHK